jgi:hypothetical protein
MAMMILCRIEVADVHLLSSCPVSLLTLHESGFDADACRAAGASLHAGYASAEPFPHIVVDDLLDADRLRTLLTGWPDMTGRRFFDRDQERFKYQLGPEAIEDEGLRDLLYQLNSPAFLGFLEALTGIEGLVADPDYLGGGLHETRTGGHLSIHADFNLHPKMRLERRINLLLYLNDDWAAEWGGDLELWDREMKACRVRVAPLLGRVVIFATDADSFHGHPDPLACPADRARRSIATYYYAPPRERGAERTTRFQVRPGSGDRPDREVAFDHFVQDWVPRPLRRFARRLNPFRG